MLAMHFCRGILFDHMQERHVRMELLGEHCRRIQGGFGELRAVKGDKDVLEHVYPPKKIW
jgi:hypothetical protein